MRAENFAYFSQDVTRHCVFQVKRKSTNKVTGIIFIISFLLWVAVVVNGVIIPTYRTQLIPAFDFGQLDSARISGICVHVLLSVVFILIAFILLRWIPGITKFTLAVFWISIPCSIVVAYLFLLYNYERFVVYSIFLVIASILSCIFLIVLLNTEGFHMPEKVLKEACKMIISVPSTMVFALFMNIFTVFLMLIIILITVKVLLINEITAIEISSIFINLIFGFWTVSTSAALSFMTLSGTFAEYYWIETKNEVSLGTILHLFCINVRYHIGTAAMHCGLLGGLRVLSYLVSQAQIIFKAGASLSEILFYFYNAFEPILFRIVSAGGAAMCSVKGTNFYHSMTHTMKLFMNKPRRVLVVFQVIETLMIWTAALVYFSMSFSISAYLANTSWNFTWTKLFDMISWESKFWILSMTGGTAILLSFFQCLYAAFCSTIFCVQEEVVRFGDALPCESYAMSRELHSALQRDGRPNITVY